MKIYNLYDKVIFENDSTTMRETVKAARVAGVSLRGANLERANLEGANLYGADLRAADLRATNLRGSDLREANLCETYLPFANLSFANLRGAILVGANLRRANLRGADLRRGNLRGADMRDAILPEGIPVIPNIHQAVYEAASKPGALDMDLWHTCETTHCRAGWVVTLAGDEGKALEQRISPGAAAALIYMASDPTLEKIPDWLSSNEDALDDMKRLAKRTLTAA